jgi:hypothetical protein
MLKINNTPKGDTGSPFLLKRNHLSKQNTNYETISVKDEKELYEFVSKKKNDLIRKIIIPKIIEGRLADRDKVKNKLQKKYSSVKLKENDLVMLKNYFNGKINKYRRRFKGPFIITNVNQNANEITLKDKNGKTETVKTQDCLLTTFKSGQDELEGFDDFSEKEAELEEEEFNEQVKVLNRNIPREESNMNETLIDEQTNLEQVENVVQAPVVGSGPTSRPTRLKKAIEYFHDLY